LAFGIAAIVGAGIFSTGSGMDGPAVIFFFLRLLPVVLLPLLMQSLRLVPVSGSAYTYSYVAFRELIVDYWLGINHGICHWEYYGRHFLE
jgi:hypothetical protein